MPWTCSRCATSLADDVAACPECGVAKSQWTVHADRTRNLVITRGARFECLVGLDPTPLGRDAPPSGFKVEKATECPVLPGDVLRGMLLEGRFPAPAQRVVARLRPPGRDRTATFGVVFAAAPLASHEVETPADAPLDAGRLDVVFVCVAGAGPYDDLRPALADAGLHLIDVTEAPGGCAPEVEVGALGKQVELPTRLLGVPTVELLEVEDVCFSTARAVLLPGGWSAADDVTGLAAVAAALDHARRAPGRLLLVAGHTDPVGSEASNLALSDARATNVHLYLSGQRAAWAAHCQQVHAAADVQSILRWLVRTRDWACDPGPADGSWGQRSKGALAAFRERFASERGGPVGEGSKVAAADWEAFFALYDEALADKLTTDVARLEALRAGLTYASPPTLACGEAWPTQRPTAPPGDAGRRRVDVLFFDPADAPDLSATPPGAGIYGPGAFHRRYLDVDDVLREPPPPVPDDSPFAEVCRVAQLHPEASA